LNNDQQIRLWNSSYGRIWANDADALDHFFAPFNDELLQRAEIKSGDHVFDIGCGSGALTLLAAEQVGETGSTIGIDVSEPLIAIANKRAAKADSAAKFVQDDAQLYRPSAPFDVALSRFGNSYFLDHIKAFSTIRQNLKPGGKLVAVTWMSLLKNPWARITYETCIPFLVEVPKLFEVGAPGPFAFASDDDLVKILRKAGWSDIKVETWKGMIPFPGNTPQDAAALLMSLGPMTRIAKSQRVDLEPIHAAVAKALESKTNAPGHVDLDGAAWIFSAVA